MKLRYYQTAVIDKCTAAFSKGHNSILIQAATGAGKTIIICEFIRRMPTMSVLILAHRTELITQASEKLDAFNIEHGVIMAKHPRRNSHLVQVASIQTISRRFDNLPPADVIFIDEAHLSCAASYKVLKAQYPKAILFGVTATPTRNDGKGLNEMYTAFSGVCTYGKTDRRRAFSTNASICRLYTRYDRGSHGKRRL